MRSAILLAVCCCLLGRGARAQNVTGPTGPVIDTIIVQTFNVFDPAEADANTVARIVNGIRFTTRTNVVRRELLFKQGERLDSALVAETQRNLRALRMFRSVTIDTGTVDDRFTVRVRTRDGWSTQLVLNARFVDGNLAWALGLIERNFLGTANAVSGIYRSDPDRNSFTLGTLIDRPLGTQLNVLGAYAKLSDGRIGNWNVGVPFRSFGSQRSWAISGEVANRRIFQFFVPSSTVTDTVRYRRTAFVNSATVATAPVRQSGRYFRLGLAGLLRKEEFVLEQDTGMAVPDTVKATIGAFVEYRGARFKTVTHFNGFSTVEDLDLSTVLRASMWVAATELGYEETGVGPSVDFQTGISLSRGFIRLAANANGLFTSTGLDSGQVNIRSTLGVQFFTRQATFLHVQGGIQESPTPGEEYDLGFGLGPRSFGPHAFVGTRNVWGTFEHRMFLWDQLLSTLGLGFAAFLDYGGAWYPQQEARFGGNVGVGIRTGFSRATGPNIGRIDFGYRFGEGWEGNRWALSFGQGFTF